MVTADEIAPGRSLKLETLLNGETMQSGHKGVGFSRKPPRYMKPGDVVEIEIEGIGILKNPVAAQT